MVALRYREQRRYQLNARVSLKKRIGIVILKRMAKRAVDERSWRKRQSSAISDDGGLRCTADTGVRFEHLLRPGQITAGDLAAYLIDQVVYRERANMGRNVLPSEIPRKDRELPCFIRPEIAPFLVVYRDCIAYLAGVTTRLIPFL
jgi:hypothetical protein